jgi:hypothetical protein
MNKAVLEKGKWHKIGKPNVVSVATPAKAAVERPEALQVREAAAVPRAVKVIEPRQGVGVPPGGRVMQGLNVAVPTVESEPINLRQTERIDQVNKMQTNTVDKTQTTDGHYSNSPAVVIEESSAENKTRRAGDPRRTEKLRSEPVRRRSRDLQGGMELLGLDFLLSIVEDTAGNEDLDVTMRRLNFKELIRTDQLHAVDSNALKVYALNADGHYDKTIQCEAIKELTARTAQGK